MAAITEQDSKILDTVLHWIWSCRLQIERHSSSIFAEWSCSEKPELDKRKIYSAASYDEHLVLVAAQNLLKALDIAGNRFSGIHLDPREQELIKTLRNTYEHWEDHQAPSLGLEVPQDRAKQAANTQKKVEALQAQPWSITFGPDGPVLCGTISLRELLLRLGQLEESFLHLDSELRGQDAV